LDKFGFKRKEKKMEIQQETSETIIDVQNQTNITDIETTAPGKLRVIKLLRHF
jgi:hypothetical protein